MSSATASRLGFRHGALSLKPTTAFNTVCQRLPTTASFHSSASLSDRVPALQVRISRKAWRKNQKKIEDLRRRLGDNYAVIGRDKRRSPYTQTNSSTRPTQAPYVPPPDPKILPFFAVPGKTNVAPIVSGDFKKTLAAVKELRAKASEEQSVNEAMAEKTQGSIRDLKMAAVEDDGVSKVLEVPLGAIPYAKEKAPLRGFELPADVAELPTPATSGPGYGFSLTPSEAQLLFLQTPDIVAAGTHGRAPSERDIGPKAQAEMVRRIVSLENANKPQMNKYNVDRCVQLFGRAPHDTGSPEVQAAVFTVRIKSMQDHLDANKKDKSTKRQLEKWISRRVKILKYLRRTVSAVCMLNLPKFVETCRAIGVEPETIRV
ncbi:uncharacterized protein EV422DRAFT_43884 [Fimicolochytrium jonesii]|uniref:uncharacterized protein n=1 Tax=Fimicolochytrium jonesii TaxID=1396493 RepID=UPI0022FE781C|nr:uncharacterized protein EV422DRAFT_43884 [Fimicolochytrium jonesii]KAI8821470.1 hypothetical protein EV422DRAFT_43884 [Fimicolochytrium jonesii]